eukprot:GHRQ01022792.1.p1 GENE.GHRQ01022792.1~~GHRQ01022792.1.p1  ORF type:complete len:111 (-),score=27.24 GHRQ01022792.1:86-418(-)
MCTLLDHLHGTVHAKAVTFAACSDLGITVEGLAGCKHRLVLLCLQATAREMAGALSYLHSKNILHGDLTGNNVLLTVTADDRRGFVAKVCSTPPCLGRWSALGVCLDAAG